MDYRERYYFLINVKGNYHNDKIKMLKKIAPSLKISNPTNICETELLSKRLKECTKYWTGVLMHMRYATHLVSIRKEDFDLFVRFLHYMTQCHAIYYKQICKEDLKQ